MQPDWIEVLSDDSLYWEYCDGQWELSNHGITFFMKAIKWGDIELVKEVYKKLVMNPQMSIDVQDVDQNNLTALHVACCYGHYEIVEWLIKKGADLDVTDDKGRSAPYHTVKA